MVSISNAAKKITEMAVESELPVRLLFYGCSYGCSYRFHLSGDDSRDRYIKGS